MRRAGMILAAALMLAAAAMAQDAPKPAPELKKLDVFVGAWTLDGTMKPGMMGPGGTMTENEKCEWMDGGFYLVCHSDYKSSMGNGVGLSVMGYSTEDKAYTYREFSSIGEFEDSRGTLDGDTWTWTNDEKMGGMTHEGPVHDPDDVGSVVHLCVRYVAGRNEVVDRDGREGEQEVKFKLRLRRASSLRSASRGAWASCCSGLRDIASERSDPRMTATAELASASSPTIYNL